MKTENNQKLYTSAMLMHIFDVTRTTIYFWEKAGKLISCKRDKNDFGRSLYDESDIIEFIKRTHNGDYAPSPIDVYEALERMGLRGLIELPVRKRRLNHKENIELLLDIPDNTHSVNDMEDYFTRIARLKLKVKSQ